MERVEARL